MSMQAELDAPENPRAVTGDNKPPRDPIDKHKGRLAKALEAFDVWDKRDPATFDADIAGRAQDYLTSLKRARTEADDQRKAEKKVHDDAGKEIQKIWSTILDPFDKIIAAIDAKCKAYLRAEEAKAEAVLAEARRVATEAEAARRAAEADAAKTTGAAKIIADQRVADAAAKVQEAAKLEKAAAAPVRIESVTGTSNARSLKKTIKPEIEDIRRVVLHYINDEMTFGQIEELVLKFAAADLRAAPTHKGEKQKPPIPGIKWVEV